MKLKRAVIVSSTESLSYCVLYPMSRNVISMAAMRSVNSARRELRRFVIR